MAQNRVEECMFCERLPCECNKKVKPKPAAKSAPKKAPPTTVTDSVAPAQNPVSPVKIPSAAKSAVQSTPPAQKSSVQFTSARTDERALERYALTVLAESEILAADSLREIRDRLDLPSWKIDALIWKAECYKP